MNDFNIIPVCLKVFGDKASVAMMGLVFTGRVIATADPKDPAIRARVAALTETGRAPVVVALADAQMAVHAVARGGVVCLPDAAVQTPTVTQLVQRELTLVSARDVAALVRLAGRARLEAALGPLLGAAGTAA